MTHGVVTSISHKRVAGVVLAATVATATTGTAASAPRAHHGPIHRLNTAGPSVNFDRLVPLVGDASTLVYYRSEAEAYTRVAPHPMYDDSGRTLMARSATGAAKALGPVSPRDQDFALYGDFLTAQFSPTVRQARLGQRPRVDWWNTATGKHGALPDGVAGPHHTVVFSQGTRLGLRTRSGHVTALSKPFHRRVSISVVGPDGVVVVDRSSRRPAYIRFADLSTLVPLKTDDDGSTVSVGCSTANTTYAACTVTRTTDLGERQFPTLVALDGGAPTFPTGVPSTCVAAPGLSGDKLVYTDSADANCANPREVFELPAGATTPTSLGAGAGVRDATAYGQTVLQSADLARLLETTTGGGVVPLVSAHRSPAKVAAFSLGPNRITFLEDRLSPSHPGDPDVIRTATLHRSSRTVRVGQPSTLSRDPGGIARYASPSNLLAATGRSVVVQTMKGIRVKSPSFNGYLPGTTPASGQLAQAGAALGISRKWVVYETAKAMLVMNLVTHQVRTVRRHGGGTAALAGSRLGYIDPSGRVYLEDLRTGRRHKIGDRADDTALWIAGRWVGWNNRAPARAVIRNIATMAPARRLGRPLLSLSPAGALLESLPAFRVGGVNFLVPTPVWLRSFSGKTRKLLPPTLLLAPPRLVGGVLAWLTSHGDLKVESEASALRHTR